MNNADGTRNRFTFVPLLVAMLVATAPSYSAVAQDAAAADFPFVVKCSFMGTDRYFYLSSVKANGLIVYISPDNVAATTTSTGTPIKINADGAGSCTDKTIDQLRASGQAYDLK